MNANDINTIIDHICEKIGVGIDSAKEFVPELARYQIIHSGMCAVLCAIAVALLILLIRRENRIIANENGNIYDDTIINEMVLIVAGIALIINTICIGYHITQFVEWIATPEAKAIVYILRMMGGVNE